MKKSVLVSFVFTLYFAMCFSGCALFIRDTGPNASFYSRAVNDAAVVEPEEIYNQLIAIDTDNDELIWNKDKSRLLVVSWKSMASYEKYLKPFTQTSTNEANVVWVSTAPQLQEFCRNYVKTRRPDEAKLEMRLKQYLGLNESWKYDCFVEMWVSPEDLFRPCVDPEINDTACELNFGQNAPKVKGISDYPGFYKNLYFSDFRTRPGVPWTGLGYTYDWGNRQSTVGASEFIIIPGGSYEIKQVIPTWKYCQPQVP